MLVRIGEIFGFAVSPSLIIAMANIGVLNGMAKRKSTNIVKKRGDSHAFVKESRWTLGSWIEKFRIRYGKPQGSNHLIHGVHDPDHVSKTVMFGTWKNVVCKAKLLDPPQSLKER